MVIARFQLPAQNCGTSQLPLNIRQSSTVGSFKKELKTHLFKLAYDVLVGWVST